MTYKYYIGQRASFDSAICTIKYIGPVEGTGAEKEWLGVEWDEPMRGKHDGSFKGKKYFTCLSPSPTAGSFIRSTRKSDSERTFLEAVKQKYASDDTDKPIAIALDQQIEISGKVVEEVGFDKIRQQLAQLHELKIVIVDGMRIKKADEKEDDIAKTCPLIVELDLSRNLFLNLDEVGLISHQLEHLRVLKLNGNRFQEQHEDDIVDYSHSNFSKITDLELDETLLSWSVMVFIMQMFVSLKVFSASTNHLKELSIPLRGSYLTTLTLEHNEFTSLSDLASLRQCSTLETLKLKGNRIITVGEFLSGADDTFFPFGNKLSFVDLSYNAVHSWNFVDSLPDIFPGLQALRFSQNPLVKTISVEESYMLILARIGKLKALNYSTVSQAERNNAEMFYLSQIGKEMATVPEAQEYTITSKHKRFSELCELHGAPDVNRKVVGADNPNFLEARLIKFTFYLPQLTSDIEPVTKIREIPRSFDTYRVKGLVAKMFNLKPLSIRLVWETGEWDPVAGYEDIDDDSEDEDDLPRIKAGKEKEAEHDKGKWMKREVEIVEGTRQVGNCVDGMEVMVRIETKA